MSKNSNEKGFSLTELVLIIGITSILATIGIPSYLGARNRYILDGEGDKLANYLREGIDKARTYQDGVDWGLSVNTDDDWYELLQGGAGGTGVSRVYLDPIINFTATTASSSVTFGGGPNINILSSNLVIGLVTENGQFIDTITVDTLGRVSRDKNYE